MYEVMGGIVDNGELVEMEGDFGKNMIMGFGGLKGE